MKYHSYHNMVIKRWAYGQRGVLMLLIFAACGLGLLVRPHAATFATAKEAEAGTPSGNVSAGDPAGASGGGSFRFGGQPSGSTRPTVVGHQLLKGQAGSRLKMDGVAVWGIQDSVTSNNNTGSNGYANRVTIANTIKAWGGNHIRLRLVADDYNNQRQMTKSQYIQQVKDWRDAAEAAGLYFMPIWWDGLDGAYSKGAWATQYSQAFPMMTDVVNALGNDPNVLYEPFNEPTDAPTDDQWLNAMKDTARHFRDDLNYTGVLVIDTRVWSHHYDDGRMTQLEQYDASLNGMGGKNQLIFAKHDYANEGYANPDSGFDAGYWAANGNGWDPSKHLTWESEFGNYNGDASTEHLAWSNGAATWLADRVNDGTLAGATAFVWRWVDDNTITTTTNTTPTTWGGYVKNNFLARVN